MDVFQAAVLGLVQGITEWLPVSSKAMVTLSGKFLFGMPYQEALATAIFLHIGTLIAATIYLRKDLIQIFRSVLEKKMDRSMLKFLVAATLMTGVIAIPLLFFALNNELPEYLFTIIIGGFLLVTAFLQRSRKDSKAETVLNTRKGIITGFFQGFAGIPGMSRSGTTITALIYQKLSIKDAMRVSFLMSIPAVLGAELMLPFLKGGFVPGISEMVGAAVAGIVGFLTIGALLKLAAGTNFWKVCAFLGVIAIVLGLLTLL
ncbi:MAG: undecaprenyl-diphosphate phosphatase [Candidatus Aenigmarchaeota archaeon]|nr:undecaprenyl-diphosphate phosphatase [Candidatus Aenigmarchaeota archaeon]